MADTNTTNLALVKPEVSASSDTWGTKLNADLDAIDALFDAGPVLKVTKGGSGAATAAGARTNFGAAASGANTDITSVYLNNTGLKIKDTNATHGVTLAPGSNITADRTLTVTTGDADRTLDISAGSVTVSAAGAALIDDADAAAQRATLGLDTGDSPQFSGVTAGSGTDQFKASVSGTTTSAQWGAPSSGGHFKVAYNRTTGGATITTGTLASPVTAIVADAGGNVGIGTSTALGTYGKLRVAGTGYQALNVGSDDGSGVNMIVAANAATEGRVGTVTNHPFDFYTNGAAKARLDTSGNLLITSSGGLGYGTGSGGAVTQLTSRTTGVTLNKPAGSITLFNAPNSTTFRSFTVTNSTVAATDVILLSQRSGTNIHQLIVSNVAAGSFEISHATTTGTTSEAPVINFAVIKAVTS